MNIIDYMEKTLVHRNTISAPLTVTQEVLDPPKKPRLDTMGEHPLVKDHLPLIVAPDHRMASEAYLLVSIPMKRDHLMVAEGVSHHLTEAEEGCLFPAEEDHHSTLEAAVGCHFPVEEDLHHQEDRTPRHRPQHQEVFP